MKVKNIRDLSPSLMKQANKDTVIKLVSTLTGALTRSSELLQLAAADVDKLKTDQLRLQSELLSAKEDVLTGKNEQLVEMKTAVKSEIKSWADVVGKNCNSSETITPKNIKEAVKSAVIEEDRLHNIMIYGLEELDEEGSNEEDKRQIAEIMHEIGLFSDDVIIGRIG